MSALGRTSLPGVLAVAVVCSCVLGLAEELPPPEPIPWKAGGEVVLFPTKPGGRFYILPAGSFPELEAILPLVSDEENAVPWCFEAMRHYVEPKDKNRFNDLAMGERHLDPGNPDLHAWIERNDLVFKYLDRAAGLRSARWPLLDSPPDPQAGAVRTPLYLSTQLPYLAKMHDFARARSLLVRNALVEGKVDEAVRQVKLAYAIPRHMDDQPFLIESLVSIACDSIILQSVEELLVSGKLNREQSGTLAEVLEERRAALNDGTRAFVGEELGGRQIVDLFLTRKGMLSPRRFAQLCEGKIGADTSEFPLSGAGTRAYRILFPDQTMKTQLGRYFEAMRARVKQPYFQAFSAGDDEDPLLGLIPAWNLVARMLLPVLHRAPAQFAMRRVYLDMARVAVALRRAELDGHRRLARLDELAPRYLTSVPVDEFNGKAFGYSSREGGWRVWSVGRDSTNDGGIRKDFGGPDVVFFVEAAPARLEHIRKD